MRSDSFQARPRFCLEYHNFSIDGGVVARYNYGPLNPKAEKEVGSTMMRITTWRQVTPPPEGTPPGVVVDAFRGLTDALKKVGGVDNVQWGFGNGGIVTVGSMTSYGVADAILKDGGMQAAVARIFLLGINITDDVFVITPEQALPFVPQQ